MSAHDAPTRTHDGPRAAPDDPTCVEDGERGEVLAVHFGRAASCSSIGSVVDVLFVSGVVGTALLAALAVMLGGEPHEDGERPGDAAPPAKEPGADEG